MMTRCKSLFLSICMLLLALPAMPVQSAISSPSSMDAPRSYSRDDLIGEWRGVHRYNDYVAEETAIMRRNGEFEFIFKTKDLAGNTTSVEIHSGLWGLTGNIHYTITLRIQVENRAIKTDLTQENNYNAYRVLKLTDLEFQYRDVRNKMQYTLERVVTREAD